MTADLFVKGEAELSACGRYRYFLTRSWDLSFPYLIFIMLNPSTADALSDDPTLTRCVTRARRLGYGGVTPLNLFAFRATQPEDMLAAEDPVGPKNDEWLERFIHVRPRPDVVCAWGVYGDHLSRDKEVLSILAAHRIQPKILKLNADGSPGHPLYVPYSQPLMSWSYGEDAHV